MFFIQIKWKTIFGLQSLDVKVYVFPNCGIRDARQKNISAGFQYDLKYYLRPLEAFELTFAMSTLCNLGVQLSRAVPQIFVVSTRISVTCDAVLDL